MSEKIKIRKGLDIKLKGIPEKVLATAGPSSVVAIQPSDFIGMTPKMEVKAGDEVKAGTVLFHDKYRPELKFVSPVSGEVAEIVRGEKRRILEVRVLADKEISYQEFGSLQAEGASMEDVKSRLLESGLWSLIRQRPFNIIPNSGDEPKSIFVSALDTNPLGLDVDFALTGQEADFKAGLQALDALTTGKVHLNISKEGASSGMYSGMASGKVQVNVFEGPHPAGNVGTQIHSLEPINKGESVWFVAPQDLVIIGRLFNKGVVDMSKIVAVGGAGINAPKYFKTIVGTQLKHLLADKASIGELGLRVISGSVLSGTKASDDAFLGYYDSTVAVIPEGDQLQFFLTKGWLSAGLSKFSVSKTYFSWLAPRKSYNLDTNLNGEERSFVMTGQYEKVFPFNIYPVQLIKAIIANDLDLMEQLGAYEVDAEDFALCEFVCTSKTDVQNIVRNGLEDLRAEVS
ncbi:MAG: Na+-transporting NADH:ubiquinone oxidoreductase subunit A [Sphingobacteriales bacterium]|jgi:Na+-transporting NADH:ubiquinone oxidoreductase subunit A